MYPKILIGFLIASLSQVVVIFLTESLNISSLGANMTIPQILLHILVGQAAGFLLLFLARRLEFLQRLNFWVMGLIWGLIVWSTIVPIQVSQGKLNAPWNQDTPTLISSLVVFMLFGIITAFTVKAYGLERSKV